MQPCPLISLDRIDVFQQGAQLLRGVTWEWRAGENWLVYGANGAGKSTFLRLVHGDLWPHHSSGGRRLYHLDGETTDSAIGVGRHMGFVSAEQQDHYHRSGIDLAGRDVILSGFHGAVWNQGEAPATEKARVEELAAELGIGSLLGKSILVMSSGERRKLLIARALVKRPPLLLLDEALNYLDAESRAGVAAMLERLMASGTCIVYTTHRRNDFIPGTTHRLVLKDGAVQESGPFRVAANSGAASAEAVPVPVPDEARRRLVAVENADVYLNNQRILHGINWEVWTHENWAVIGANGSGKSTLLRLIAGEHYPAWGGMVKRFEFRVTGNIWEVKELVGFVSAETQTSWPQEVSVENVVLSGFFGTKDVYTDVSREQRERAAAVMEAFYLDPYAGRAFGTLSYGEKRRTLLARAMVNRPVLLVLDEPCNGLDEATRDLVLARIHEYSLADGRVLYATHHPEEIPATTTHVALMEKGRLAYGGARSGLPPELGARFGIGPGSGRRDS